MSAAHQMYPPPHSQAPPQSIPLDIHGHQHQLPALSQPSYAAHAVSGNHPAMALPPPAAYGDHQYGQHAPQDQLQTPTTPAHDKTPTADQLTATTKALEPVCGKQGPWTFRCVALSPRRFPASRAGRPHR